VHTPSYVPTEAGVVEGCWLFLLNESEKKKEAGHPRLKKKIRPSFIEGAAGGTRVEKKGGGGG